MSKKQYVKIHLLFFFGKFDVLLLIRQKINLVRNQRNRAFNQYESVSVNFVESFQMFTLSSKLFIFVSNLQ